MLLLRYNHASVAVSKASKTSVHFVEKGTKVDARYYRETLLQRCLLPEICQNSKVRQSFPVSAGQCAVASSKVDRRVPAAYRAELHWSVCMVPQQPRLEPGWLHCMGVSACIAFRFPIWTISRTECAPAGRILTNRSSTSLLISEAVVQVTLDTLNSCFDYLVHLLSCSVVQCMSFKNMRASWHCVLSVTVVLWQEVNLAFQDKMYAILYENNLHLKWHIIQHCVSACILINN